MMKRGKLNYLALQTPGSFIVATRLQPGHILILLGRMEVRLGLLLYEMEMLARRLELTLAAELLENQEEQDYAPLESIPS